MMASLSIFVIATACAPSLHPLYTDDDRVYDPALVGTWVDEDGNAYEVSEAENGAYEFTYFEKSVPAKFKARLVRLGEYLYVDVTALEPPVENDLYKAHLLQLHTFSRIRVDGDVLYVSALDYGWLTTMLEQERIAIPYDRFGETIVLTASTAQLREFVLEHADDPEAFPEEDTLRRQS